MTHDAHDSHFSKAVAKVGELQLIRVSSRCDASAGAEVLRGGRGDGGECEGVVEGEQKAVSLDARLRSAAELQIERDARCR